ncbi:MAG TPA: DUF1425 domain-containing protein [Candidatus Sumerlaeota bacterium]|nr:DUF1425 domain-containing protein [Candidatus Sumerlaeota bacterium]
MQMEKWIASLAPALLLASTVLVAPLTGCSNQSPNVLIGQQTATGGVQSDLLVVNPRLQKRLTLLTADSRRVNDLMQVNVQIQNTTKKPVMFEHKFQWFDVNNFEISDPTAHWNPDRVEGMDVVQIPAMAPAPNAVKFKILVRDPAPITH